MATKEETEKNDRDKGQESQLKKGMVGKIVPWLVPVLAIVACASAGFFVGRLFGARGGARTAAAAEQTDPAEAAILAAPPETTDAAPTWYYHMDSVIGNLNEPGVVRYVRMGLTLEIGGMTEKEGVPFLEQKKPLLKNWLTLYLNNLSLNDVRGERNLRQMQTQIADAFNQNLFPGAKPRIKRILFKELSIQ
jgi:flagellar basal body-associated protein FliL